MTPSSRYAILAAVVVLGGCISMAPEYKRPETEFPASWSAPTGKTARDAGARWWTVFGDSRLDQLVDEALAHNADLELAVARVDEARALLGVTRSEQYPAAFGAVDANRSQSSTRTDTPLPPGTPRKRDDIRAAIGVSYELDLWGRLRDATEAARAELLASDAARETVRIALVTDVIQGYFSMLSLDEQYAATQRSLATRSEALALQKLRYENGVISEFEYRQLEAEVEAARALLPALERRRFEQENALAVLLGRNPRAIYEDTVVAKETPAADTTGTPATPVVPDGLPSELLLRRPDLVEAEQRLIAANARIGVARAAYFPSIALTGYAGSESASLGNLFASGAGIWQAAVSLTQPLWVGGLLRSQVEAANARQRQALAIYRKSIQNAFRDVRNAIMAQSKGREQYDAENARVNALRETLRLAKDLYENGVASQLDLLDAERNLLAAQILRSDALRGQRAAVADLFKALGGDWKFDQATVSQAPH